MTATQLYFQYVPGSEEFKYAAFYRVTLRTTKSDSYALNIPVRYYKKQVISSLQEISSKPNPEPTDFLDSMCASSHCGDQICSNCTLSSYGRIAMTSEFQQPTHFTKDQVAIAKELTKLLQSGELRLGAEEEDPNGRKFLILEYHPND